jgi:hypothetical protein
MRKEASYAIVIAAAVIIALSLWVWSPWAGPALTDYQAVILAQCWTGYEMHGHDVSIPGSFAASATIRQRSESNHFCRQLPPNEKAQQSRRHAAAFTHLTQDFCRPSQQPGRYECHFALRDYKLALPFPEAEKTHIEEATKLAQQITQKWDDCELGEGGGKLSRDEATACYREAGRQREPVEQYIKASNERLRSSEYRTPVVTR